MEITSIESIAKLVVARYFLHCSILISYTEGLLRTYIATSLPEIGNMILRNVLRLMSLAIIKAITVDNIAFVAFVLQQMIE